MFFNTGSKSGEIFSSYLYLCVDQIVVAYISFVSGMEIFWEFTSYCIIKVAYMVMKPRNQHLASNIKNIMMY